MLKIAEKASTIKFGPTYPSGSLERFNLPRYINLQLNIHQKLRDEVPGMYRVREVPMGPDSVAPILKETLPEIDALLTGCFIEGIGSPEILSYYGDFNQFFKPTYRPNENNLKVGSGLAFKTEKGAKRLTVVISGADKYIVENFFQGVDRQDIEEKNKDKIVAIIVNGEKGEIQLSPEVAEEDIEIIKKMSSALSMVQNRIDKVNFSSYILAQEEKELWKVVGGSEKIFNNDDVKNEYYGLEARFERLIIT